MKRITLLAVPLVAFLILAACGGEQAEIAPMPLPTPIATYAFVSGDASASEIVEEVTSETGTEEAAEESATEEAASDEAMAEEEPADTEAGAEEAAEEDTADDEATAEEEPADTEAGAEEAAEEPAEEEAAGDGPYAGLAAAMGNADSSHGEQLTLQNACIGCHSFDPDVQMVGPTWHNLTETAATQVEGQSAIEYLYTSITEPNAYVPEGFSPNIMVSTYGDTLSDQDLADMITYLLEAGE